MISVESCIISVAQASIEVIAHELISNSANLKPLETSISVRNRDVDV